MPDILNMMMPPGPDIPDVADTHELFSMMAPKTADEQDAEKQMATEQTPPQALDKEAYGKSFKLDEVPPYETLDNMSKHFRGDAFDKLLKDAPDGNVEDRTKPGSDPVADAIRVKKDGLAVIFHMKVKEELERQSAAYRAGTLKHDDIKFPQEISDWYSGELEKIDAMTPEEAKMNDAYWARADELAKKDPVFMKQLRLLSRSPLPKKGKK